MQPDSVRWMIEKLNHPDLYKPWPDWLVREVARQNAERDAERRAHHPTPQAGEEP